MTSIIYNRYSGVAVDFYGIERDRHHQTVVAYYTLHGTDSLTGWEFTADDIEITSRGDIIAGSLGTITEANGPIYQAIRNALNIDQHDTHGSHPVVLLLEEGTQHA